MTPSTIGMRCKIAPHATMPHATMKARQAGCRKRTASLGRLQNLFAMKLLVTMAIVACSQPALSQWGSSPGSAATNAIAYVQNAQSACVYATPERIAGSAGEEANAVLPDAPVPVSSDASSRADPNLPSSIAGDTSTLYRKPGFESSVQPSGSRTHVQLKDCPFDESRAGECRMHWKPMLIESAVFNAFENAGNLYTGFWYRYETMHGHWWQRYVASAAQWRWDRWSDDNPAMDDYVGHPIMGAITDSIWIQNDPQGMTLEFANERAYWRSRFRAVAWSTFYSFEWKLGPLGEASVGHNGDHYFYDKGVLTNETGWVELVTTPVGGLAWTVAEDYLDKHVVRSLEEKSRNPLLLTVYQFLTPAREFANILRFRPPWFRDSRVVKADSFWSDPGKGLSASTLDAMKHAHDDGENESEVAAVSVRPGGLSSSLNWQGPGGRHEIGAWWGVSIVSGHIWGYAGDVKYMPVDLRYSWEIYRHKQAWTMRYSPEVTAIAMIDWPTPNKTPSGNLFNQRKRVYGSGVSPAGFQWDFLPLRRVQPFFSGDGGAIYFSDRVRYQHLSNGNISHHNPGTDANTLYVGISRFRTKGDQRPDKDLR